MNDRKIFDKLGPFVHPIIKAPGPKSVEFVGSGFLLKDGRSVKLITAAHVMDHHDESKSPLFIATEAGSIRIKGLACSSPIGNAPKRKDDKIDLTIVLLDADSCLKLRGISSVTQEMLDLANSHDSKLGYLAMGFPAKKSDKSINQAAQMAEPEFYGFRAVEADDGTYKKLGVSKETHIALHFEKNRVFSASGEQRVAPDLKGLSGTPIWGMVRKNETELKAVVVAILIAHHQEDIKAVLGTRLSGLTHAT